MEARSRWLTFLIALCAAICGLRAQDGSLSLQATLEPSTAKPGDTVKLVLTATVSEGWHAYGTKETVNIPIELPADTLKVAPLVLDGDPVIPPGNAKSGPLGTQYPLPETFVVTQSLRVPAGAAAGEVEIEGALRYQICDANMCLPPDDAKFAVVLKVAGAGPARAEPLQLKQGEKVSVRATCVPKVGKPGETVVLHIEAVVDDAFHAYGSSETTNIPVAFDAGKAKLGGLEADGGAMVPPGEPHEHMGMTQYPLPNRFEVTQKLRVPAGAKPGKVELSGALDYQICDESSCLPPDGAPFTATFEIVAGGGETKPGLKLLPDANLLPDTKGKTITVKASFEPANVHEGESATLVLDVEIAKGYHAYGSREPINLPVLLDAKKLTLGGLETDGDANVPPGTAREGIVGTSYPLPDKFQVTQRLRAPVGHAPGEVEVKGTLRVQVCDEKFQCQPPEDVAFAAKVAVEKGVREGAAPMGGGPKANEAVVVAGGGTAGNPAGLSLWGLILACVGGALFALAMPCTYPMIPITFSFFTKQAEKRGGNVMSLALVYGFGIVLMFVIVGVLMSGVILAVANHWITNAVIGIVFLLFAFSLFGWIDLQPPRFLQDVATTASGSGGVLGVFFMGAALVITSFTCTAPIVGTLISSVATQGVARVAIGMTVFGLVMALPFVFLSLAPSKVKALPRSGQWMDTLKVSLGFVEIAATLKFVSMVDIALDWNALPRELFLLLIAAIFVMWAMYLFGILRKAGTANEGVGGGRMATGMAVVLLATYLLFGALGYKLDFYMTAFAPPYSAPMVGARAVAQAGTGDKAGGSEHAAGHTLVEDDPDRALVLAKAEDKLLLYNFTGFN